VQWAIASIFLIAVFITRIPIFFRSVLDWDESLYLLMAEQWRAGHLPYTTIWDNKPIGIYAIFALFLAVFGDHVASIRIASACFVAINAFIVFRISLLIPSSAERLRDRCAVFAGAAYIIGSISNDGLAANTEIFMACFTAAAVLCAASPQFCLRRPALRGLIVGLLFGMAIMVKYVAIFELFAVAFALLALRPDIPSQTRHILGAIAGIALPALLTIGLYAANGELRIWWESSVASNFLRVATPFDAGALNYTFNLQVTRWLPLFVSGIIMLAIFPWCVIKKTTKIQRGPASRFHLLLALWLIGGCLGVASAKSFYDHYFLQLLPVLCVCLSWVVVQATPFIRGLRVPKLILVFAVILLVPCNGACLALEAAAGPVIVTSHGKITLRSDTPAEIARDITSVSAASSDCIYVFDYQPVIYSLTRKFPPTKYVLPSVLTTRFLAHVAGVDANAEVSRILETRPEFIIRSLFPPTNNLITDRSVYAEMNQALAKNYVLWRTYNDAVIFRIRSNAGGSKPTSKAVKETCRQSEP
jgi:4-amino-4-deoxy-L-arabinose transferase-like glycosyltransferase